MAMYQVYVPAYDALGNDVEVPVVTNLKTAKSLVQANVDIYRCDVEHLRQKSVEWTRDRVRTDGDDFVLWSAYVDAKPYSSFRSV